jgi:hypothetical protein
MILALALMPAATTAQEKTKKAAGKAEVAKGLAEQSLNRELFSGSESRIAAMNSVNADCTPGPVPSLRIVTAPENGTHRLEEMTYAVDRPPGDARASCNGKLVSAVGIFYKSNAGYIGPDRIVIDVDFKNGSVRRFNYKITVR